MRFQVTVKVRSDNEERYPNYTYERTTSVRLSDFGQPRVRELIEEAQADFKATFPHNHAVPTFAPVKVTVLEVD